MTNTELPIFHAHVRLPRVAPAADQSFSTGPSAYRDPPASGRRVRSPRAARRGEYQAFGEPPRGAFECR